MGIRVGLTLFSVVALMIILGTTQTAYAGSLIMVTVEKTTTSGDGIFTFDLANPGSLDFPEDTCSINTQTENSCNLESALGVFWVVTERPQAGWMQDSTTCPGVIDPDVTPTIICQFVNSPKSAIGGEIIPLDTTMVLVAGSQNTAAWMIPVIVSAIGIGIVIARKF